MCDRFRVRHAGAADEPCLQVCCVVMVMCVCDRLRVRHAETGRTLSTCVLCCHGDVDVCVTGFVFAMLRLWTNLVHMCVVMVMCMCV